MEETWRKNIKYLRKQSKKTQASIASHLHVTPQTIGNWETGISGPGLEELITLSKFFGVSTDDLLQVDLSKSDLIILQKGAKKRYNSDLNSERISDLTRISPSIVSEPVTPYFASKMPAVVTVDHGGIDNILYVPVKAQAGYLIGYEDPTFIEELPSFRMPGLANNTYRMFEAEGISMAPTISDRDRVICEWVKNFDDIRENRVHVIIEKNGVRIKRVLNRIKERGKIYLKSDTVTHRSDYPLIELDPSDVLEMWYVRLKISSDLREPSELYTRMSDLEILTHEIAKKLNIKP
jgi:transcriptional regulator with XRE-family HTH domain